MAGDYFNIKKTTFVVNILVYIKPLNSMEAQKHGNKEKLSAKKSLSLFTCNSNHVKTIKTLIKKLSWLY